MSKSEDYLIEEAINSGSQLTENKQTKYIIRYTNSELDKIVKLSMILGLSKAILLESAISYLYFNFINDKENTQKIIDNQTAQYINELEKIDINTLSRKERDRIQGKITLSPEIFLYLDGLTMNEKINEAIFIGINLLHERLI